MDSVWGIVRGPSGPLSGVQVTLLDASGEMRGQANSDREGVFRLARCDDPATGFIVAVLEGFAPGRVAPKAPAGGADATLRGIRCDVTLEPLYACELEFVWPGGETADGITFRLMPGRGVTRMGPGGRTSWVTDPTGRAVVDRLSGAGTLELLVGPSGSSPAISASVQVSPEQRASRVQLPLLSPVTATLVGSPAAVAATEGRVLRAEIATTTAAFPSPAMERPVQQGETRFESLVVGAAYRFSLAGERGRRTDLGRHTVTGDGQAIRLELSDRNKRTDKDMKTRARAIDFGIAFVGLDGERLSKPEVAALGISSESVIVRVRQGDGREMPALTRLSEGRADHVTPTIQVETPARDLASVEIDLFGDRFLYRDVEPGSTVPVLVPEPGELGLVTFTAAAGTPHRGPRLLHVDLLAQPNGPGSRFLASPAGEAQGSVPPGPYVFRATATDGALIEGTLHVDSNCRKRLDFGDPGTLSVSLGRSSARARRVALLSPRNAGVNRSGWPPRSIPVPEDGRVLFRSVAPGAYQVSVLSAIGSDGGQFDVAAQSVEVEVTSGGRHEVDLVDDGDPRPNLMVTVDNDPGALIHIVDQARGGTVFHSNVGPRTNLSLPPGDYEVVATPLAETASTVGVVTGQRSYHLVTLTSGPDPFHLQLP